MTPGEGCNLKMRLGVHVSIAGSLDQAVDRAMDLGCTAMQIFARNPRAWHVQALSPEIVGLFREKRQLVDISPAVIHTPYLINLASFDEALFEKSVGALVEDLRRADALGIEYVVTHIGSARGQSLQKGMAMVSLALDRILTATEDSGVALLLENTAGHGALIGGRIGHIGQLIRDAGNPPRLGFCLDTCHAFAGGYELRTKTALDHLQNEIEREIGLERLKVIHLNDCKGALGSHLDRHEHIGEGHIGLGGFATLLRHSLFDGLPWILETPKKSDMDDRRNLATILELLSRGRPETA
ncbi:MAG: deoxyribonuclease IV [Desulfovibrionales bacterium]|nr:deoxyribonuclease IV [Desulfovibrionales bacterium]